MENVKEYTEFLIQSIEKEAEEKRLQDNDNYTIQWAEMKLLLSQLKNGYVHAPATTNDENEVFEKKMVCCTCGTETSVTRIEQFIIKPDTEVVLAKCINCLIDTLKGDQAEFQQTRAYLWFLKEHNLEEDFEAFMQEVGNRQDE